MHQNKGVSDRPRIHQKQIYNEKSTPQVSFDVFERILDLQKPSKTVEW